MEVQLVNPWKMKSRVGVGQPAAGHLVLSPPRRSKAKKGRKRSKAIARNGAVPIVLENRRRSARRYSNPLILPNRRRRHHRNPATLMATLKTAAIGTGIGAGVWALNKYGISKIGITAGGGGGQETSTKWGFWVRQLSRFVGGALGAYFFPGTIGASIIGAMSYPMASELERLYTAGNAYPWTPATTATSARLEDVEAELADVLDGVGAYDYAY